MKAQATPALYPEILVLAVLGLLFVLGVFFVLLRPWYPFIGSYVISRLVIWYIADVLKIRLERPLIQALELRHRLPRGEQLSFGLDNSRLDYSKMKYQDLRGILKDPAQFSNLSDDRFQSLFSAYMQQVRRKIHIHHFIFGIPLMPVTWALYFYNVGWAPFRSLSLSVGMVFAGLTFALFMSEFWHLLTQDWGP
jgi:prepilin signal peptidase PulO-like enzyme (type II secretory pathway)